MLSAIAGAGCGDAILCDSSPLVVIQSPTSAIAIDGDPATAGVQTEVHVRSTLLPTDGLELSVLDEEGDPIMSWQLPVGEDGSTVFAGVTVPSPRAKLRVVGRGMCGIAEDTVDLAVTPGSGCELQLVPAPQLVAAYPIGVLNAAADLDAAIGFQAQIAIATREGWRIEIYESSDRGEQLVAQPAAGAMGMASIVRTLPEGPVGYRAVCRGPAGEVVPTGTTSAIVDTTPPTCDIASPVPGTSITPHHDQDGNLANGVQLAIEALVGGGDAAGEPVQLRVSSTQGSSTVPMTPVDPTGKSQVMVTLDPMTTPATYQLDLTVSDHAGNPCNRERGYDVVYQGCAISVSSPTTVTMDADGVPANGSQVDVQLMVSPTCAGRLVTSTCGSNSPQGTVPASGPLTLRVNMCGSSPCEAQSMCTFRVSTAAGVQTQTAATFTFDDRGPPVTVQLAQPTAGCGSQLGASADVDPSTPGVQVLVRVTSPGGQNPRVELTNAAGTVSKPAPANVPVTLTTGLNVLTGVAFDALDNRGQSAGCNIVLAGS